MKRVLVGACLFVVSIIILLTAQPHPLIEGAAFLGSFIGLGLIGAGASAHLEQKRD